MRRHVARSALLSVAVVLSGPACREAPRPRPTTTRQMTPPATPPMPQPAPPVVKPEPYHVHVEINSLRDPQAGWLRIERLAPGAAVAWADGRWIEPNIIEIKTKGAARIAFDLSQLPTKPGRRIVLRLDKQGIDLGSSLGPTVRFECGRAGVWSRVRDAP